MNYDIDVDIKKIVDRLPLSIIPENINQPNILRAISRLKTERNNALHYEGLVIAHNRKVNELFDSGVTLCIDDFLIDEG